MGYLCMFSHVMLDLRWKLNDCQGVSSSHWTYIYGYKLAVPSFGMLYVLSIVYKSRNQHPTHDHFACICVCITSPSFVMSVTNEALIE